MKSMLDRLSDQDWGPAVLRRQSRYVAGLCERCGGEIAPGDMLWARNWLHGPAEVTEHVTLRDCRSCRPMPPRILSSGRTDR